MKKHILICGEKGVGKSTLIERLLKDKNIPLYGFLTKRTQPYETGFHQVYMFAANEMFSDEKHKTYIGQSNSVDHSELIEVFDTLGV